MHSLQPLLAERAAMRAAEDAGVDLVRDQPGGLAQGPEEKCGRAGRTAGGVFVNITLLAESTRRVGTAWPAAGCSGNAANGKCAILHCERFAVLTVCH